MRRPPERPLVQARQSVAVGPAVAEYPQAVLAWLDDDASCLLCQRSVQLWHAIHEELSAIVGISGFVALYNRCVVLCAAQAPWLAPLTLREAPLLSFDALGRTLASRAPAEALAASRSLFLHFYELLLQLIGAALTDGVLDAAWRDRPALHYVPIPPR